MISEKAKLLWRECFDATALRTSRVAIVLSLFTDRNNARTLDEVSAELHRRDLGMTANRLRDLLCEMPQLRRWHQLKAPGGPSGPDQYPLDVWSTR